jgi:hypothetical protein
VHGTVFNEADAEKLRDVARFIHEHSEQFGSIERTAAADADDGIWLKMPRGGKCSFVGADALSDDPTSLRQKCS